MSVRFYLPYDIKIIFLSYFWLIKCQDFTIFNATSLPYVTKSVNHERFIDFIAWRYITPRRDIVINCLIKYKFLMFFSQISWVKFFFHA